MCCEHERKQDENRKTGTIKAGDLMRAVITIRSDYNGRSARFIYRDRRGTERCNAAMRVQSVDLKGMSIRVY